LRPGIEPVLNGLAERGWLRVLVTNQQGVAKRLLSEETLAEIHSRMQDDLGNRGAAFDAIYAATGLEGQDPRRKPSPQMLHEAARDLGIDLTRSWMIGDDDRDILAGERAGTRTIRLAGSHAIRVPADFTVGSLHGLQRLLEFLLRRSTT
jgi:D-glycero-D-manno-heptose 1,7-bisphosphate phosphatase